VGEGKVYLVGAGPGDSGLITIKGLEVLQKADAVIYDRLVAKALLKLVPERAEKIYVGKHAGRHTLSQSEINEVMVERARGGMVVVRLKGGDPFLFGRGGEEAEELWRSGVKFEVVPGVTSALAAPAYAGIPVTHRGCSSSVGIVTGHEDPVKERDLVDWGRLATAVDTIVVLMGVRRLKEIVGKLIEGGRGRNTGVAIIEWGTTRRQRTIIGTLGDIVDKAAAHKVSSPAVVVIGEVVGLGERLHWFEREQRCR
jgi:uroporphyrinogen III methyltransferase/synthase